MHASVSQLKQQPNSTFVVQKIGLSGGYQPSLFPALGIFLRDSDCVGHSPCKTSGPECSLLGYPAAANSLPCAGRLSSLLLRKILKLGGNCEPKAYSRSLIQLIKVTFLNYMGVDQVV